MQNREMLMWVSGVVCMLAGASLFYFLTQVAGVAVGATCGVAAGVVFSLILDPGNDTMLWITCAVFAICGIVIGYYFVRLSLNMAFAMAGIIGGLLCGRLGCEIFGEPPFEWTQRAATIVVGCGLTGLLACMLFRHTVVVLLTSVCGAALAVRGLPMLHERWLIWALLLIALSAAWQSALVKWVLWPTRKRPIDDESYEHEE